MQSYNLCKVINQETPISQIRTVERPKQHRKDFERSPFLITNFKLRITECNYEFRITDFKLRITDYGIRLRISNYGLRIIDYGNYAYIIRN